jgi:hypothetical protein
MINITRLIDKCVAELKSYDSAKYTKLAKNLLKISELSKELDELKEITKQETKELVADLFDEAEDITKTRIVKTVSFTFTLSKNPAPRNTVAYAKVLDELTEHLTPELLTKLTEIKEKYTSTTIVSPSLKVKPIEESIIPNWIKQLFAWIKNLKNWGINYDRKLNLLVKLSKNQNLI